MQETVATTSLLLLTGVPDSFIAHSLATDAHNPRRHRCLLLIRGPVLLLSRSSRFDGAPMPKLTVPPLVRYDLTLPRRPHAQLTVPRIVLPAATSPELCRGHHRTIHLQQPSNNDRRIWYRDQMRSGGHWEVKHTAGRCWRLQQRLVKARHFL